MSVVVEGVKHSHTKMLATGVLAVELLQDVDLELGGLAILVDVLDDLHRHVVLVVVVSHFHHLAEGPLAQGAHDLVPVADKVSGQVGQVAVTIVRDRSLSLGDGRGRAVQGQRRRGRAGRRRAAVRGGARAPIRARGRQGVVVPIGGGPRGLLRVPGPGSVTLLRENLICKRVDHEGRRGRRPGRAGRLGLAPAPHSGGEVIRVLVPGGHRSCLDLWGGKTRHRGRVEEILGSFPPEAE